MDHSISSDCCTPVEDESTENEWAESRSPRYNVAVSHPPRWHLFLTSLASPAVRLHRLRNLRAAMFREATCEIDCGNAS